MARLRIPVPSTEAEQKEVIELLWPQVLALRTQRIALADQLGDLIDSLKDSEFALLADGFFAERLIAEMHVDEKGISPEGSR